MSLSTWLSYISTAATLFKNVTTLQSLLVSLVQLAEQSATGSTTGSQKLASVLAGAKQYLAGIVDDIDTVWPKIEAEITARINSVVALFNALGWGDAASGAVPGTVAATGGVAATTAAAVSGLTPIAPIAAVNAGDTSPAQPGVAEIAASPVAPAGA